VIQAVQTASGVSYRKANIMVLNNMVSFSGA